jgi:hypothetical protein
MDGAEIALVASVVVSGLWSGLLLTLTTILHPMFVRLDGPDSGVQMRRFLPIARRSPTNYTWWLGSSPFRRSRRSYWRTSRPTRPSC